MFSSEAMTYIIESVSDKNLLEYGSGGSTSFFQNSQNLLFRLNLTSSSQIKSQSNARLALMLNFCIQISGQRRASVNHSKYFDCLRNLDMFNTV